MNYTADIDERIARHLSGEITLEEQLLLEKWLAESSDNLRYFKQMNQLWKQSELEKMPLARPIDVESALAKTKAKIQRNSGKGPAKLRSINYWVMGIAASIALLVAAFLFFQQAANDTPFVLATKDDARCDTLRDGSVVSLNQYSSLDVAFTGKARRVKMQGEAYFQVAHNPGKPFVIEAKQVEVTVVGTKFNINTRSDSTKVIVSVEEGRVRVQIGGAIAFLSAGEEASIDCLTGTITRRQLAVSGNVTAWANRQFVFDDVPLSEVIPLLEKVYQVDIRLENKDLERCRLHVRYNNEPIERILMLIAETFSLEIKSVNGQYLLDGAGCD